MSLLEEAKRLEIEGAYGEAAQRYEAYVTGADAPVPDIRYKAGMALLRACEREFQAELYEKGIRHLMKAYNEAYAEKDALYALLWDIIHAPNAQFLQKNYERRKDACKERYDEAAWPSFEALPCVVFPIRERVSFFYDKKRAVFLEPEEIHLEYAAYAAYMLDGDAQWGEDADALWVRLLRERQAQTLQENIEMALDGKIADRTILAAIEAFHVLLPHSERYECMLARYYSECLHDNARARVYLEQGLKRRPLNVSLKEIASKLYFQLGIYDQAAAAYLFLAIEGNVKLFWDVTSYDIPSRVAAKLQLCLQQAQMQSKEAALQVVQAMNSVIMHARDVMANKEFYLTSEGMLSMKQALMTGRTIAVDSNLQYFCGLFSEYTRMGTCAMQTDLFLQGNQIVLGFRGVHELLDARLVKKYSFGGASYPCLLPFMGTDYGQELAISYKGKNYKEKIGKLESNFFRVNAPVELCSDREFAIAAPVELRHDPRRKKLVINILVDALSFKKMKENNFALMPRTYEFFHEGVIFAKNYTPAEWTMPSNASIETGAFQDSTQIFHPDVFVRMDEELQTIAQRMREQGYYNVLFAGLLSQSPCNAYRGFHRIVGAESIHADVLVANAIKTIHAMRETDVFLHMHLLDAHIHGRPVSLEQKTNLELEDYLGLSLSDTKSVWSKSTAENLRHYEEKVKQIDRVLSGLYDYLMSNYKDDEFVFMLHSDHGIALIGEEPFLFKPGMANAAFMARGGNVPSRGIVEEEVTNTLDLYATLAHLCDYKIADGLDCRLPKVFGGAGREYSISNSLYPGQTYKLCIHTLKHVFFLETKGKVTLDGRVNMNAFTYQIFTGDEENVPVQDVRLANYFIKIALEHTTRIHDFSA